MSKMEGEERIKFVTKLLIEFAKKANKDIGAEPRLLAENILKRIDKNWQHSLSVVEELCVDPVTVLENLERIETSISHLIFSLDNLPYQVRNQMLWGNWDIMTDEQLEAWGLEIKPEYELYRLREKLQDIEQTLLKAVRRGEKATSSYRKKRWHRLELIALMRKLVFCMSMNPHMRIPRPKKIVNGSYYAEFIEGMAKVYDIECSNIERNYEYFLDIQKRLTEIQGASYETK